MDKTLHTKWGNAKINNKGYYYITSKKEGNNGKLLHRLVFEDYHNCKLDKKDNIHHIDGDPLNNHPANLICMSGKAHSLLHNPRGENNPNYGKTGYWAGKKRPDISEKKSGENHHMWNKKHSEESRQKMSKSHNNTGYYRVGKQKSKTCKQGFQWRYRYPDENGKEKSIYSVDIKKLEKKVKAKGLKWREL